MVKTEKSLKYLISQHIKRIKGLRAELADRIAWKKEAEADLRTIRWDVKLSKKAVKKTPDFNTAIPTYGKDGKATKKKVVKKLYRPNPLAG